ncbi:hypothetical protein E1B28_002598 [Marasmius oreades]|uniref:Uncharacterized protein n=1 Tax=Marasmius oreades TaxID=181124 RepID=A0A9P7ULP1_9AGAR|nr:uncharacterized protein E1B28_002598 [Marasmius oreades]KAG7086658.1 hypothetical protein E1B28_002598 [Marasmius oreades]
MTFRMDNVRPHLVKELKNVEKCCIKEFLHFMLRRLRGDYSGDPTMSKQQAKPDLLEEVLAGILNFANGTAKFQSKEAELKTTIMNEVREKLNE